jgi:hypothetical protein
MLFSIEVLYWRKQDLWIILCMFAKHNSWFACHVIGTRHTYELWRKYGGPNCEKWLGVLNLKLHLRLKSKSTWSY